MEFSVTMQAQAHAALVEEIKRQVIQELREAGEVLSPYLTTDEAAVYLRCSRERIWQLVSQKQFTVYKDGKKTLLARDEVEAYPLRDMRPARRAA